MKVNEANRARDIRRVATHFYTMAALVVVVLVVIAPYDGTDPYPESINAVLLFIILTMVGARGLILSRKANRLHKLPKPVRNRRHHAYVQPDSRYTDVQPGYQAVVDSPRWS